MVPKKRKKPRNLMTNIYQSLILKPNKNTLSVSIEVIQDAIKKMETQRSQIINHFFNLIQNCSNSDKSKILEQAIFDIESAQKVNLLQEYGFDFLTILNWTSLKPVKTHKKQKNTLFFANGSKVIINYKSKTLTWENNNPYISNDALSLLTHVETYQVWNKECGATLIAKINGKRKLITYGFNNKFYKKHYKNSIEW